MCGICGVAFADGARIPPREQLRRMTDVVRHRGPDGEGYLLDQGVGLGVRRLSVIDIEHGDQPITNEDGAVAVICNGEIYNYLELRQELIAAGHRLRTRSDVEVIVHLYEDHGERFLTRLRGMFALALWDQRRRRLLLARDRLGIKPLHYAADARGLLFGSEIKSLLAGGVEARRLDLRALADLFQFGFVPGPRTLFAGVQRLPPGCLLTYAAGELALRRWWSVAFPAPDAADARLTERDWAALLRDKLTECVRLHLRSDAPLGAWLSAGLDSSAVVALMGQLTGRAAPTFSLRFDAPAFDEFRGRRTLVLDPELGALNHQTVCRREHFALLPRAVWHSEDVFTAGIEILRLLLAESAAKQVKVVLTGEGADEVLAGYPWYRAERLLGLAARLPARWRRVVAQTPLVRDAWPSGVAVLAGPSALGVERYRALVGPPHGASLLPRLLSPEVRQALAAAGADAPPPRPDPAWPRLIQLQHLDLTLRLPDSIVHHLDRGSMAHSLEARVPFLDHELVELCARIPPRLKLRGLREKHILRRALVGVLPPEIVRRRKRALQAPVDEWLRGPPPDFAAELLSAPQLRRTGYFDPGVVERLLAEHRRGRTDRGRVLMGVLGVQLWRQLFLRDAAAPP